MAWYTTEETLYFYETRRGLEPTETEQDAHLTLTLSTQEEYDRETGRVEQTQVQVDYAWSAGRPRLAGRRRDHGDLGPGPGHLRRVLRQ